MSSEDFVPGAAANIGTNGGSAPGSSALVGGLNAGNIVPISVDSAGKVNVNDTNNSIGTPGSAVPSQATQIGGTDGTNLRVLHVSAAGLASVDGSGVTQPVSAASLPLPTGAATAANQATANTSLASIDTKTPALGQALAAASTPVVLTAAQITTLTPPSSVTVTQGTGTNLHTVVDSGTVTANAGTGTFAVSAASLPLPTGAATSANQTTANTSLSSIATNSALTPINTVGSYSEITNLTTAAQTFTAPAKAVGFLLEADDANTGNVRWKIGSAATTSSGMKLQPGRDSGFLPCAGNVSVIADAGTNQIATIQWVMQA